MNREARIAKLAQEMASIKVRMIELDRALKGGVPSTLADMREYLQLKRERAAKTRKYWDIYLNRESH